MKTRWFHKIPLFFTICFFYAFTVGRAHGEVHEKQAAIEDVAFSKEWLNLLYYQKNGSGYLSHVEKEIYFMDSARGAMDPAAELRTAVATFQKLIPSGENHPQCLFPARYRFVKRHFAVAEPVPCPKLDTWRQQYAPLNLSLVYASQYISNPASVFGHSFLMLPSERQTRGFWLTYSYAANMPSDISGPAYVFGGLAGWYLGDYAVMPYYHQVYQYGSVENRDLWVYKVKLDPIEFDFVISHLWELVHAANFRYFFLNENCAGILLRTFAATLPEMQDASRLPLYVHPIEVVKELQKAGRLGEVDVIPSQYNVLQSNLEALNPSHKKRFYVAINHPDADVSDTSKEVSESLIQYTAYMLHKNSGELPTKYKNLERNAHIQRAKFAEPALKYPKEKVLPQAPHLSHQAEAIALGGGGVNGQPAMNLSYRFGVHDLTDASPGYLKNSIVECLTVHASATQKEIWLQELTFARVESYQPFVSFDPRPSWRMHAALKENLLTSNPTDLFAQVKMGFGASKDIKQFLIYALLTADLNQGVNLPQDALEMGPEIGATANFRDFRTFASVGYGKGFISGGDRTYSRASLGMGYTISPRWAVVQRAEWSRLIAQDISGSRFNIGLRYFY